MKRSKDTWPECRALLIRYDKQESNNYQYIVLEIDPEVAPLNRDEVVAVFHAENVLARKYFWPGCHRMEPYRSLQPNADLLLPNTERVASRICLFQPDRPWMPA